MVLLQPSACGHQCWTLAAVMLTETSLGLRLQAEVAEPS